jgi:prophage DNA circulation protein
MPKNVDDVLFEINKTYQNRPDLLAFDLYGDSSLWWVFALRNPNTIKDPVFDMKAGRKIYLPKKSTLDTLLG